MVVPILIASGVSYLIGKNPFGIFGQKKQTIIQQITSPIKWLVIGIIIIGIIIVMRRIR